MKRQEQAIYSEGRSGEMALSSALTHDLEEFLGPLLDDLDLKQENLVETGEASEILFRIKSKLDKLKELALKEQYYLSEISDRVLN